MFIGAINLITTVVSIRLVDRIGRRRLLFISLGGMFVTLVLMGMASAYGWGVTVLLICMIAYIASFAVGLGPVFWVLVGELFPPGRGPWARVLPRW